MTQKITTPTASSQRLLSEAALADELGVHPDTLAMWRRDDVRPRPRHLQIGRAIRYRREDVDAFLAACAQAADHEQPSPVIETA
ncbi:helix-turn-helix domain-containing protein [Xenophilus azovorans]|uniref:helix-turn-helix domain-containing protein n=2 Tax=Xenophilus azovorans TaxID=151755 RepID=UPI00056F8738|nr:helix-turn-helix domain-containing protein [Xenophilus azovorans]